MRNLKRVLSLALAAIMLVGMMVVGASAVNYNDFTDKDEIVNKDAVSMLTTLGVIEGTPDGSFKPADGVDRAQMAKMVSIISNQGVDKGNLYEGTPTGLTDVKGHWAEGHINFCYTTGIIAGRGNNTFDPNAGVTGTEAAKMLLVAAGYNAQIEGLTGAQWQTKTIALASKLGIFRDYTKDVTAPLTRDDAALLIYNALDVEMIEKYEDGYAIAYNDHRTILSYSYGVYKVEGVVVGNKWAELDETDSDAAQKSGKTVLDNVVLYSSTTSNTTVDEGIKQNGQVTFNVDTPVDYMGKTVTMYIRKTTILSNSEVLGVATKDSVNVVLNTAASTDTLKDFVKGEGLTATKDTEYYVNYGYVADIDEYWKDKADFNYNGIEAEVIDNNDDGDIDYVLYTVETLSKVSYYSAKNEKLSFHFFDGKKNDKTFTAEFEDVVFDGEFTTDDLILYVQYGGRTYISAPEIVTGVMSRVDNDRNDELFITVEGETYKQSYIPDVAAVVDADISDFDITKAKDEVGFDTKYDFILDSNGYVVAFRPAENVVPNYALVLNSAWTQNALDVKGQVEILMADGTKGTYYLNWKASEKAFDDDDVSLKDYLGTRDVVGEKYDTGRAAGTVITYTIDDDDMLTIKSVLRQNELNGANIKGNKGSNVNVPTKDIVYLEDEHHSINTQYKLDEQYTAGDGYIEVRDNLNTDSKVYAVDKNTLAFYYDNESNKGYVATGWNNMGTVAKGENVQVYPVLKKDTDKTWVATNLANVVLFGAAPQNAKSDDYLLVLSANAITSKILELNVVFEDGTTAAIEVDRAVYDDYFDKKSDYFMDAYTYTVNSDGTYDLDLDSRVKDTDAELLKNGTLDVTGLKVDGKRVYPTLVDKTNVWDVTDMSTSGDNAPAGNFVVGIEKAAVIIYTDDSKKVVRTAWIWDEDDGPVVDPGENKDYTLTITNVAPDADDAKKTTVDMTLTETESGKPVTGKISYEYTLELLDGGKWVPTMSGNGSETIDGTLSFTFNYDMSRGSTFRIVVTAYNTVTGNVTGTWVG